jgi:hypothetical protein
MRLKKLHKSYHSGLIRLEPPMSDQENANKTAPLQDHIDTILKEYRLEPRSVDLHAHDTKLKLGQDITELIHHRERIARIDENQRWANGYASALHDNPGIDDPQSLQAAKLDFEDRIKQLSKEDKDVSLH